MQGRFEFRGRFAGHGQPFAPAGTVFSPRQKRLRVPPIPGAVVGVSFFLESLEPPIGLEPGTYTLAVTVDLATARDWKERPDTTCAGFPVALASRSYRAEVKETPRPPSPTS